MTILEKKDLDKSKIFYKGFTFMGALTFGYMSFRYRRMKISMMLPHE